MPVHVVTGAEQNVEVSVGIYIPMRGNFNWLKEWHFHIRLSLNSLHMCNRILFQPNNIYQLDSMRLGWKYCIQEK
jgi:hypothetical protein